MINFYINLKLDVSNLNRYNTLPNNIELEIVENIRIYETFLKVSWIHKGTPWSLWWNRYHSRYLIYKFWSRVPSTIVSNPRKSFSVCLKISFSFVSYSIEFVCYLNHRHHYYDPNPIRKTKCYSYSEILFFII